MAQKSKTGIKAYLRTSATVSVAVAWLLVGCGKSEPEVGLSDALSPKPTTNQTRQMLHFANNGTIAVEIIKGVEFYRDGKYKEALDANNIVLELSPTNMTALYGKELSLTKLGRYTEALETINVGLSVDPNFKEMWGDKYDVLTGLGRTNEAEECLKTYKKLSMPQDTK